MRNAFEFIHIRVYLSFTEAATGGVLRKKVFLKVSKNETEFSDCVDKYGHVESAD